MQATYFWHKFNLHGIKVIFIVITALCISTTSFGQKMQMEHTSTWETNLPNYDNRLIHYGFIIGANVNRFIVRQNSKYFSGNLSSISTPPVVGFNLGFIGCLKLTPYLDLRLTPTVAFYDRGAMYKFNDGKEVKQYTETVFIEFPLLLKYKSQRRKNHRLYMVAGIKAAIEAGDKRKEEKNTDLRTNNFDFCIDYGFGSDLYLKYFKLAPEIRFSHGFVNLLYNDPNVYAENLQGLFSHTITLYFHFE